MIVTAPAPNPALGRLREHERGAPEHAGFVVARIANADGGATTELSTAGGTRLWKSPDDELPRVLVEARAAAQDAGQAVAIITAEPGHWQQLFVLPVFRVGEAGALQAVTAIAELDGQSIRRGHHLVGLADVTASLDLSERPVDPDLLPPRARPGA